MTREVRNQLLGNSDRPNSRSPTPVWDAESFMKVEVANIGSNEPRAGKTHLCIHIRSIHVNLPSMRMDDFTHFNDGGFINAMSGGVSNHECPKVCCVLLSLSFEVCNINITVIITSHGNNFETSHYSRGWVRSVSRCRNNTDVTLHIIIGLVVTLDG